MSSPWQSPKLLGKGWKLCQNVARRLGEMVTQVRTPQSNKLACCKVFRSESSTYSQGQPEPAELVCTALNWPKTWENLNTGSVCLSQASQSPCQSFQAPTYARRGARHSSSGQDCDVHITIPILVIRKQTWKDKVTSQGYTDGKCLSQSRNLVTLTLRTEEQIIVEI